MYFSRTTIILIFARRTLYTNNFIPKNNFNKFNTYNRRDIIIIIPALDIRRDTSL